MEKQPQGMSDSECFDLFSDNPLGVSQEIIKGSHKFIANTIKNGVPGPNCQTLIKIFSVFSKEKIKDYVFTRMTKPILLELALCLIQQIVLNGPEKASSIELELVKTKSGGKIARIADPFCNSDEKYDANFLSRIDEAFFTIRDKKGLSPDVSIASGQGHKAPYSAFSGDGTFVRPRNSVVRSLEVPFEVNPTSIC